MKNFSEILKELRPGSGWQMAVDKSFERKSANYSTMKFVEVRIFYNGVEYSFPKKIIFDSNYTSQEREITRTESTVLNGKRLEITETSKIIPLGFYERKGKYSGTFSQIISDALENCLPTDEFHYQEGLLSFRDNPLYAIDSKIEWSSYLLVLKSKKAFSETSAETYALFEAFLTNYGIHYSPEDRVSPYVLLIFPMQYVKIVENKIRKTRLGEEVFLVLEYNQTALFNPNFSVIVHSQILNTRNQVIYNQPISIKYNGTKYEAFRITPNRPLDEIGYADFNVRINNIEVDRTKGYYIRKC